MSTRQTLKNVLIVASVMLMAGLVVSCEPKEPDKPPPPPPPTPEEIEQAARDVWKDINNVKSGESLKKYGQRGSSALQNYRQEHGDTETGMREIQSFITKVSGNMRKAMEEGNWEVANIGCQWLLALSPNSSQARRAKKKIRRELAKPKVALTGFMDYDGKQNVMFEVILPQPEEGPEVPEEDRTKSVKVLVGDEFYGYRLRRIVPNQQATIVYLDTNTSKTLRVRKSE